MTRSSTTQRRDRAGCPICGSRDTWCFLDVAGVPVRDGLLWDSAREAAAAPTGDIRLRVCRRCAYIGNEAYDAARISLGRYDFSLQHSASYRRFIRQLSNTLVRQYRIRKTRVLDVGCGDAMFLKTICAIGHNRGVGIEPAFVPHIGPGDPVTIIRQRFSAARAARSRFGLIACRHVLSEVSQPGRLLRSIRKGAGAHDPFIYLEVPNASQTFGRKIFWNVVYEHRSWFLPEGLRSLCAATGLEVAHLRTWLKRDYVSVVARPRRRTTARTLERPTAASLRMLEGFRTGWDRAMDAWHATVDGWRRQGVRVVAWGAGARAVSFCAAMRCGDVVDSVVDINPARWGKFLPVSAVRVDDPRSIQRRPPDVILITNPTYTTEIKASVERLGVTTRYVSLS